MSHASFLLGERVIRPGADTSIESGYQVLRLATELVPSTLALLGTEQVSPFWAVLFYFILILFGIAQQVRFISYSVKEILRIRAYECAIEKCSFSGEYTNVKVLESFVNISVGDLALRNNRYNGDQYENDEALGDHDHVF